MSKDKKTTEVKKPSARKTATKNSIMGVLLLFAVASIAYSTVVIVLGTEGYIPMILVAPQALLAVTIAINKFAK